MTRPLPNSEVRSQHSALTTAAGVVDLSSRTQIEITGADAVTFLHNMCTNDIKRLEVGGGCEAFLTNVQGKILGHVLVFRGAKSLILDTSPDQAAALLPHLDRYVIREDVQLHDRGGDWGELLLAGPDAPALLGKLADGEIPGELLAHRRMQIAGKVTWLRRVELTRPVAFLIACDIADVQPVSQSLVDAGAVLCGDEALDIARLEAGTPYYGRDVGPDNLPQEVDRNDKAISLTKGCYLGQETVARIDALGHVNRTLVGLKIEAAEIPDDGAEITTPEKSVGRVTSAVYSPRLSVPLALAYVRRQQNATGTQLWCGGAAAEVIDLPLE